MVTLGNANFGSAKAEKEDTGNIVRHVVDPVYFLPLMLYSSRKVPGTSTFTSCPVPKRELREELLELLELCCWRRSCCCLLCSSSLSCSCLCCSILSFSSLSCSCLCCSILICSSLSCSSRAAAWACWALNASETRVTILGCRMFKIFFTNADFEEEEDEVEEELKLDPVEENFDPDEKEVCC